MMKNRQNLYASIAIALLAGSSIAQAHPRLISSTPVAHTTVPKPTKIMLNFSERLIGPLSGGDIFMTKAPGRMLRQPVRMSGINSTVAPNGKALVLAIPRPLQAGSYQVNWHAVSIDTHRVQGNLVFDVK